MPRQINALILDDSIMTRKMIMKDLEASGLAEFTFTEADDGQEGLEKFRPDEFDIIFADMQMPRKDGVEFLTDLHKAYETYPPAVMITSERSMEVLERAAEAHFAAFLLKPVDTERLRRGLKKIIDALPDRGGTSAVPYGQAVPDAMAEMLSECCSLEAKPIAEDETIRQNDVVFGTISMIGELQWSVVAGFKTAAAIEIAKRFAGFEIPADSPDMGDAISELINIVAGHTKRLLNKQGVDVEISLPTVHTAQGIKTITQRSQTAQHNHFETEIGPCWTSVTVGLESGLVL